MKKFVENFIIVFGCVMLFAFMLTGTYVFANDKKVEENKSFYVEKKEEQDYYQKNLELTTSLVKRVENSQSVIEYNVDIVNGNVILVNLNNGSKSAVYSRGDAKYLTTVNYYYNNAEYILIITEDGTMYANIYKNNDYNVKFVKVKTNNKVSSVKVLETKQKFHEYPAVELFGVNEKGDWEKIKL